MVVSSGEDGLVNRRKAPLTLVGWNVKKLHQTGPLLCIGVDKSNYQKKNKKSFLILNINVSTLVLLWVSNGVVPRFDLVQVTRSTFIKLHAASMSNSCQFLLWLFYMIPTFYYQDNPGQFRTITVHQCNCLRHSFMYVFIV